MYLGAVFYLHKWYYPTEERIHLRMNKRMILRHWCTAGYNYWEQDLCIHPHLITNQKRGIVMSQSSEGRWGGWGRRKEDPRWWGRVPSGSRLNSVNALAIKNSRFNLTWTTRLRKTRFTVSKNLNHCCMASSTIIKQHFSSLLREKIIRAIYLCALSRARQQTQQIAFI